MFLLGSLRLSHRLPCSLLARCLVKRLASFCWFQRAFMFPLAIVLGLGLWWQDPPVGRYGVALALGGAAVALYHIGLYVGLIPEAIQPCTATGPSCTDDNQVVFGIPIPLLALVAFTMIGMLSALSLKEKQT